MKSHYNYFLFYFMMFSTCLSDTGYNTIYLMEFDNLKNDFPYAHLEKALPDLIMKNYDFREDIKIEYIDNINPYIEKYKQSKEDSLKGFIINGRFQLINNKFHIEYEAYDMNSWDQLVKRQIYCPLNDITCVHDAFIISIEGSLSPFLVDKLDVQATIQALEKAENKSKKSSEIDLNDENHDLNELENLNDEKGFGDKYYREFNLKKLMPNGFQENDKSLQNLSAILMQVLYTPYDVLIGEMKIELDGSDPEMLKVEIPIQYSMLNLLSQELLTSLPINSYLNMDDEVIFQFSKNDFDFDGTFKENMFSTKFQMIPVIYFMDEVGMPQFIILDSWLSNKRYKKLKLHGLSVLLENQFNPLFSLTEGIDNVELAIKTGTLDVTYRFSLPYEYMDDYVKVIVKFMQRNEIEMLLEKSIKGEVN